MFVFRGVSTHETSTSDENHVNICTSREFSPRIWTHPGHCPPSPWCLPISGWSMLHSGSIQPCVFFHLKKTHTTGRQPFGWNPYGFMPGLWRSLVIASYLLNHPLLLPPPPACLQLESSSSSSSSFVGATRVTPSSRHHLCFSQLLPRCSTTFPTIGALMRRCRAKAILTWADLPRVQVCAWHNALMLLRPQRCNLHFSVLQWNKSYL